MDYSAIINSTRVERLELVEILAENRLDLLETLNHLTKTSPSMTTHFTSYGAVPSAEG